MYLITDSTCFSRLLLLQGIVERVTFVLIDAQSGAPLERFIFEVGYPILRNLPDERSKDQG